jgi:hypothetical protein
MECSEYLMWLSVWLVRQIYGILRNHSNRIAFGPRQLWHPRKDRIERGDGGG